MKNILTDSISFLFKGPFNLRLGYYFPLYNTAIIHVFNDTKYNRLVRAHEVYSHPLCSREVGRKWLILFYAYKSLSYPDYTSFVAKYFEPILEGAVLADLFFIERELCEEMLAKSDPSTRSVAQKFIELIQCALKWREKSAEEYTNLHPLGRVYVRHSCGFFDFIKSFKEKAKLEFVPISNMFVNRWMGFKVLDILHKHLQDPQKNCIPQWIQHFAMVKAINMIEEWLLALLLAGSLIYQHIDEENSLVGVAFCSRELLDELRVFEIVQTQKGLVFIPKFFTPPLFSDIVYAILKSLRETFQRYSDSIIPFPFVYLVNENFQTIPTNLLSNDNLPFLPSILFSLAYNIYSRKSRSYNNLAPYTLAQCAKEAIIAVYDAIVESYTIWKREKINEGIGQIFNYIELGTRTTGTISSIDESVYYLLSGWFYLARVSKIFNAAWEFLNRYSSHTFSRALDNAFEKSQYYCFSPIKPHEDVKYWISKEILEPNAKALALMPKQKREEFLAALAPFSL